MKTFTKYLCTTSLLLLLFPIHVFAVAVYEAESFLYIEVYDIVGDASKLQIETSSDGLFREFTEGDAFASATPFTQTNPMEGSREALEEMDFIEVKSITDGWASPAPSSASSTALSFGGVTFENESDAAIEVFLHFEYFLIATASVDSLIAEEAAASAGFSIEYGHEEEIPTETVNGDGNGRPGIIERSVFSDVTQDYNPANVFNSFDLSIIIDPGLRGFAEIGAYARGFARSDIESNQVPEPATLFLLGTGLVGLIGGRKRFITK